jgi:hypothetical protein
MCVLRSGVKYTHVAISFLVRLHAVQKSLLLIVQTCTQGVSIYL